MKRLCAMALLACAAQGVRAADAKIAVADVRRVMSAYPEARQADAVLRAQLAEYEKEQDAQLAARGKLIKELQQAAAAADNKALSDRGREDKRKEVAAREEALRKLETDMRETVRQRQKELADQERRMRERITEKLKAVVAGVAAKGGYALVLDSSALGANGAPVVLYDGGAADITAQILEQIGPENEREQEPESPEKPDGPDAADGGKE